LRPMIELFAYSQHFSLNTSSPGLRAQGSGNT
jgi:hypothetical protein